MTCTVFRGDYRGLSAAVLRLALADRGISQGLEVGADAERQRMQHSENLKRMITVTAFLAVRLLHLRKALQPRADDHADRCGAVLEEDKWRVLWKAFE